MNYNRFIAVTLPYTVHVYVKGEFYTFVQDIIGSKPSPSLSQYHSYSFDVHHPINICLQIEAGPQLKVRRRFMYDLNEFMNYSPFADY